MDICLVNFCLLTFHKADTRAQHFPIAGTMARVAFSRSRSGRWANGEQVLVVWLGKPHSADTSAASPIETRERIKSFLN
jgi:hypothetical protein